MVKNALICDNFKNIVRVVIDVVKYKGGKKLENENLGLKHTHLEM